jgi:SAM-dependent methyltransferase
VPQLYDMIGIGYRALRRPDPRIAAAILNALGPATSVVNVGAGAGSYEPVDRRVVAVEPSREMIRQRPAGAAPVVQASATALPFRAGAFDAALAVLTVHHWPDRAQGLAELRRVARDRVVILTWLADAPGFWLVEDYFPEMVALDRIFPTPDEMRRALGPIEVHPLPIPHDCTDGFLGAYWRRPQAYLDAAVRGAISSFSKLRDAEPGLSRLRHDLADGTWTRRYGSLLTRSDLDLGYRLIIAPNPLPSGERAG